MLTDVTVEAFAKINLTLDILGKLPNNYHELRTVMQSISLSDLVKISLLQNDENCNKICLTCSEKNIPVDVKNTAYRAALIFLETAKIANFYNVQIDITKNIPSEAGLGGASADAAAVLVGLNALFGGLFSLDELCEIGVKIGADVPFCVVGGTKLCENIGEVISTFPKPPKCYFVIAKGEVSTSTAVAFAEIDDKCSYGKFTKITSFSEDISLFANQCFNIFDVHSHELETFKIKENLYKSGAFNVVMSGSGSAVYGIFDELSSAEKSAINLRNAGYFSAVTVPLDFGNKIIFEEI